jgi:hypothetical protein
MVKRIWARHRRAVLASLFLLVVGLLLAPAPWALILALVPVILAFINPRDRVAKGHGTAPPSGEAREFSEPEVPALTTAVVAQPELAQPVATPPEPSGPLIGGALLAKVKELGDLGKSEIVRACGYVSQKMDGSERLNFTAFYEALLEAKGLQLSPPEPEPSPDPQGDDEEAPDYRLTAATDGSLLFTNTYTRLLDLLPGDEFSIRLAANTIILAPLGSDEDLDGEELASADAGGPWPVTVDSENNIRIPADALRALGTSPGQQFLVRLGRKRIRLESIGQLLPSDEIVGLTTIQKRVLAESPTTSPGILNRLLNDSNTYVQAAARRTLDSKGNGPSITSADTTAGDGGGLSRDWSSLNHDDLVLKIQNTEHIPPQILENLASKNYWRVREAVAVHPCTPESLLERLAEDPDSDIQAALKRRHFPAPWGQLTRDALLGLLRKQPAPVSILAELAQSQSGFVRAAAAANPAATAEILESLAGDSFSDVRRAVACAENTPSSVVETLALDGDAQVRSAITLRRLPVEWRHLDEDERIEKLAEPTVPPEVLEVLSHSGSWTVRQAVARNRSVDEAILNQLKDDDDSDVASAARDGLLNRKLPEQWRLLDDDERIERLKEGPVPVDVLELLAISADWRIRQAVARHEGTPDAVLNQLAKDDDSDVKQAIEDRRLPVEWRHLDEDERIIAIRSTSVTSEVLEILSSSPSWRLRQAVASTTRTPLEILQRLSRDRDSDVQRAATESLVQSQLPEEWKQLSETEKILRLTSQPAPPEVLELLAQSSSREIRNAVSLNKNSSVKILLVMKGDASTRTRINRLLSRSWALPDSGWEAWRQTAES